MKVNKLDLYMILLWFALFQFNLPNEKIYYIYQFVIACSVFGGSFSLIKKNPYYFLIFLYPLTIVISCVINRNNILITQVARGFTSALLIVDTFLMVKRYEIKRGSKKLFYILYKMSTLYTIINIFCIITSIITKSDTVLFSRSKFSTSYMFVFYLLFFSLKWNGNRYISKKWKKTLLIIQSLVLMGCCSYIETSTGIIALFVFLILSVFCNKLQKIIANPFVLVGMIVCSMFLIFGLSAILKIPIVEHVIVNLLHEDLGLTGRMELYNLLFPLVVDSGLWGRGFGSYAAASLSYHGWLNAQNGLAEIILGYGFAGGFTFLVLVYFSVAISQNKNTIIYSAIFVFIIVAIVEIPFNNGFILLLSLLQVRYDESISFVS